MRIPFFGRSAAPVVEAENDCPHLVLSPTWDNAADMGNESKASGYRCYACGETLSLEESKQAKGRSAIAV